MTDQQPSVAPKRPRWLFPVLIASLALNLLFIGGFATAAWHHRKGPPRSGDYGLLGFVKGLPAERQAVVSEQVTAARDAIRPLRRAVRDKWSETNSLMTVEPFDKEKFKSSMAELAEAEARYVAAVRDALAATAEKLTPDERRLLQNWREKRRPGSSRHHKGRDASDDDK